MRGRSSGKTGPPVPGLTRVGGGAIKGARSTSTYWQLGRWVERRFSKTMDRIRFQAGLHRKHDRKRRDEKENILFRFLVKKGGRGVLLGGGGGSLRPYGSYHRPRYIKIRTHTLPYRRPFYR